MTTAQRPPVGELTLQFEQLWEAYVAKVARLRELRATGRYGFQLRQPKRAVSIARKDLQEFCDEYQLSFPGTR